jgi:hypothetical protein
VFFLVQVKERIQQDVDLTLLKYLDNIKLQVGSVCLIFNCDCGSCYG